MKLLQEQDRLVFRSADFTRQERESLLGAGFLQRVIKGWYVASRPGSPADHGTPWLAAMTDFIARYCDERFGDDWYVAPGYSLHLHAGATALPLQVVIHTPHGTNSVVDLPDGHSLVHYRSPDFPAASRVDRIGGLRVLPIAAALIKVPQSFFEVSAADAQIVLAQLADVSDINRELLAGGNSVVAGRLAGALRAIGRDDLAADILGTMRSAGYSVSAINPFARELPVLGLERVRSPYVLRLQLMWRTMREDVIREFPTEPGRPTDLEAFMKMVRADYASDAYHSLSIEGYRVTQELVERVASGNWNPERHATDADARNEMVAHGYWRAFELVTASLRQILTSGASEAGEIVRKDHGAWFRALFAPSVEAGILAAADLAGYRNGPVYIRGAMHVPPPHEAVREMMPALFDLLRAEQHAGVRAVLGHFCFVFIHPYMDGNGRIGRFLMNAMMASGGYPWTIVRVEWRDEYMAVLDAASARGDIVPLTRFLARALSERTRL